MSTIPLHGQFIDGQVVVQPDAETFASVNPANGDVLAHVQQAAPGQIDRAVESARNAQKGWAALPAHERGSILSKAAQLLGRYNDDLAFLETLDTGKPLADTRRVDIVGGASVLQYCAGLAVALEGQQMPAGNSAFCYTRREPLGVVAGIGAWNYPMQIALWKAAPALAAGNSMIFKPSEVTPLGALKLAEVFAEAGVPPGVFSVVQGDHRTGDMLARHPDIAKISFTGSVPTGKKVTAAAALSSLKGVTMELGGKSPLIVFPDADIERSTDIAMMANFFSSGQVCSNGTRVFVHSSMLERFQTTLLQKVARIRIGDPLDLNTNFGPLVSTAQMEKVLSYIEYGNTSHARLLAGGRRPEGARYDRGCYVLPTVFGECHDDMRHVKEEIFGPVLSLLSFEDEDEVIARANNSLYGLAAGIVTNDLSRAHRVIHQLEAGICWINAWGRVPAQMPVGGYKESGLGQENGVHALHPFTRMKSVYLELGGFSSVF